MGQERERLNSGVTIAISLCPSHIPPPSAAPSLPSQPATTRLPSPPYECADRVALALKRSPTSTSGQHSEHTVYRNRARVSCDASQAVPLLNLLTHTAEPAYAWPTSLYWPSTPNCSPTLSSSCMSIPRAQSTNGPRTVSPLRPSVSLPPAVSSMRCRFLTLLPSLHRQALRRAAIGDS